MNTIQVISAPTLGQFETLFNTIFPDATDNDIEIIENVHRDTDADGKQIFTAKVRRI